MLEKLLQVDVYVSMVILAMEYRLAPSILAPCDVELELPVIEDLVVAIKWTQENFVHTGALLSRRIVSGVKVICTCHVVVN